MYDKWPRGARLYVEKTTQKPHQSTIAPHSLLISHGGIELAKKQLSSFKAFLLMHGIASYTP